MEGILLPQLNSIKPPGDLRHKASDWAMFPAIYCTSASLFFCSLFLIEHACLCVNVHLWCHWTSFMKHEQNHFWVHPFFTQFSIQSDNVCTVSMVLWIIYKEINSSRIMLAKCWIICCILNIYILNNTNLNEFIFKCCILKCNMYILKLYFLIIN